MSNTNRFALETPALTGGVVMEGHARYCRENGHAFNRKDGIEQGWCPRCGEDNGLVAAAVDESKPADEPVARNFEVHVFDASTDFAVDLDVDTATAVLAEAGLPIVGLARKIEFDGAFWIDVPKAWYDALEESGDDFDGDARGYSVHACMY